MFARILVPTDFSEPSDAALEYARVLAARFGSSLHLLHVVETPFVTGPLGAEMIGAQTPAAQAELYDEARARLSHRASIAARSGVKATTEIVTGTAARSIIETATDRRADLIVMGTHGRSGMAHLIMGSIAEKIVRYASCPVLTVRGSGLEPAFLNPVSNLVAVDA